MSMMYIGIAQVATAVINIGTGLHASAQAENAAERQADKEARIERQVTEERLRQLDKEEEVLAGETIARAAGSGVKASVGSPLEILAEQAYEFEKERLITADVGASKAKASLDRGSNLATQYRMAGVSNTLSGLSDIFSIIGDMPSGSTGTKPPPVGIGGT